MIDSFPFLLDCESERRLGGARDWGWLFYTGLKEQKNTIATVGYYFTQNKSFPRELYSQLVCDMSSSTVIIRVSI